MKLIKLCLIAPAPPPYGGIANWVALITRYVEKNKAVDLHLINVTSGKRGVDGRTLWDRIVIKGFLMFKIRRQMLDSIKENRADIIHITTSGQFAIIRDILLLKTAKKKGVPTVYHIRFGRVAEIAEKNTMEWKLISKAMKLASEVMVIDNTTYNAIKKHLPSVNTVCIPNPVDTSDLPAPIEAKGKEVMFLGWVVKTKGIEELLTAWATVYEKHNDWSLTIAGPYKEDYFVYLKNSFSQRGVTFIGEKNHNEAMEILNKSEVFVLPSYTEGFPNVIAEAMALKKPIIATGVGAIPDMLSGNCGLVIPPKNSEAVKAELLKLIENPQLRKELSDNAYKKANEQYSIDSVFERYINEWSKLVKQEESD